MVYHGISKHQWWVLVVYHISVKQRGRTIMRFMKLEPCGMVESWEFSNIQAAVKVAITVFSFSGVKNILENYQHVIWGYNLFRKNCGLQVWDVCCMYNCGSPWSPRPDHDDHSLEISLKLQVVCHRYSKMTQKIWMDMRHLQFGSTRTPL